MKITSKVSFETSMGDFVVGLCGDEMPVTVENFLEYVRADYYNGTIFHRVISGFMAQGGGLCADLTEKTPLLPPIKLEIARAVPHMKYTLSMARTQVRDSAQDQFFICTADNRDLDGKYAAFGTVVGGHEVIDAIGSVKTRAVHGHQNLPATPVIIHYTTYIP